MATASGVDDMKWPNALNKVITKRWSQLKNTLVMKDFVDHLIQRRVVTLEYWISLKSKPITESERTEDFLSLVLKFDKQKFNHFLEALLTIDRQDLVKQLMKCQESKPTSGKSKSDKTSGKTKPDKPDSKYKSEKVKRDLPYGQTDCDQLPNITEPKPTKLASKTDGHNGSLESNSLKKETKIRKSSEIPATKTQTNQTSQKPESLELSGHKTDEKVTFAATQKARDNNDRPKEENQDRQLSKTNNISTAQDMQEHVQERTVTKAGVKEKTPTKTNHAGDNKDIKNGDLQKEKIEELTQKEELLNKKEKILSNRELKLQEREDILNNKEKELLTRENSLINGQNISPPSASKPLQTFEADDSSYPVTTTTTQSTDIFADVRDQLAELKKEQEIESEHTTSFGFNKEDFVRAEEFQAVQNEIEELREEIVTDRNERKNILIKMDDLQQEIEILQSRIKSLQMEKQSDKSSLDKEVNRLKTELKNSKLSYNDAIAKIRSDLKEKENECEKLKNNLSAVKKDQTDLNTRVQALEHEREKFEQEVLKYEKQLSDLRNTLEDKETQLSDLRKALEDTENEKEDLVEEVSGLKTEVARLKVDRKRLEQEKKTLLGRCVKPGWNPSTNRKSSFK